MRLGPCRPPFALRPLRYAAAMRSIPLLTLALLLAAGGVTKSEADALDDAAEMVEQQRLPADAVTPAQPEPSKPAS
jgi:hypothetical protein